MPEYPWPERRAGRIFLRMPDGTEKEVEPFTAALQAQAWVEAIAGLATFQAHTIIPKLEDAAEPLRNDKPYRHAYNGAEDIE